MKPLGELLRLNKQIRTLGIDDAPFDKAHDAQVSFSGVMCSQTRFEGMIWGQIERDGLNSTEVLIEAILNSKFHPQTHAVLIDGLGLGGFNLVDLPHLASALDRPCIAVMRKPPDLAAIEAALEHLPHKAERLRRLKAAGEIHVSEPFVFQVQGADPEVIPALLEQVTDQGHVPEALRLAHLIGSAVKLGQSGRQA